MDTEYDKKYKKKSIRDMKDYKEGLVFKLQDHGNTNGMPCLETNPTENTPDNRASTEFPMDNTWASVHKQRRKRKRKALG